MLLCGVAAVCCHCPCPNYCSSTASVPPCLYSCCALSSARGAPHVPPQVALTALNFWQDMYVTALQGLEPNRRSALMGQAVPLLQRLTAGLVLRSRLQPQVAAAATADARDLPEDVRIVSEVEGAAWGVGSHWC